MLEAQSTVAENPNGVSLQARALAAYQEKEAKKERERQEQEAKEKAWRIEVLQRSLKTSLGIDCVPSDTVIEIEGINFTVSRLSGSLYLRAFKTCPECGEPIYSYPIKDLWSLGYFLQGETDCHECDPMFPVKMREDTETPNPTPIPAWPLSAQERLTEALRDLIADELESLTAPPDY